MSSLPWQWCCRAEVRPAWGTTGCWWHCWLCGRCPRIRSVWSGPGRKSKLELNTRCFAGRMAPEPGEKPRLTRISLAKAMSIMLLKESLTSVRISWMAPLMDFRKNSSSVCRHLKSEETGHLSAPESTNYKNELNVLDLTFLWYLSTPCTFPEEIFHTEMTDKNKAGSHSLDPYVAAHCAWGASSPSASRAVCFGQSCTRAPASGRGSWPWPPCCGPSASGPSPTAGTSCRAPCWPPALGGGASAGCSWPHGHRCLGPQSALPAGSRPPPRLVWPGGHTCTPPPSCGEGLPSSAGPSPPVTTASGCCRETITAMRAGLRLFVLLGKADWKQQNRTKVQMNQKEDVIYRDSS